MRHFHCAVWAGLGALLLSVWPATFAHAQTPLSTEATPGWYRMQLGKFEITALADGTLELPVSTYLPMLNPGRTKALLARDYLSNTVPLTVNAYLVNTGAKLVLIDTGAGASQMFGPRLGRLEVHLRASGYTPEQVDEVYITHLHPDHFGGLAREGRALFANAIVRAEAREAAQHLAPSGDKEEPDSALAKFKPYVAAQKFLPFSGPTELTPGIRAVPAPGHTVGHTVFAIESEGQRLVLWGDLLQVAAIQFPVPSATFQFDWNARQSARQRQAQFAAAAKRGYYVAAAHLAFPGIGKLRAEGGGYRWVPVGHITGR
jgi:glyoxylase-like metal-dependent hydrolase (beta-lactamase superfamily II)